MDEIREGNGVVGYLLNTRNDGKFIFRVYNNMEGGRPGEPMGPLEFVDYELTIDDLKIQILQESHLIRTGEHTGRIDDFPGKHRKVGTS